MTICGITKKMDLHWDNLSDAELLKRSRTEPEAFGVLYDRHARNVLAYLYRRTASPDMAADLTAETFAEALTSSPRFRPIADTALPWLLKIAQRQLNRTLRRGVVEERARQRLGMNRLELDEDSFTRIEELVDFAPLGAAVRGALDSLPTSLAQAISLRIAQDLPYCEVAQRLGCTEGAARVRVARGLSKLSTRLEET